MEIDDVHFEGVEQLLNKSERNLVMSQAIYRDLEPQEHIDSYWTDRIEVTLYPHQRSTREADKAEADRRAHVVSWDVHGEPTELLCGRTIRKIRIVTDHDDATFVYILEQMEDRQQRRERIKYWQSLGFKV